MEISKIGFPEGEMGGIWGGKAKTLWYQPSIKPTIMARDIKTNG